MVSKSYIIRSEESIDGSAKYVYRLIGSEAEISSTVKVMLYSIEVEMNRNGSITSYKSGNLFLNKDKAERFFVKLIKNLATPANLPYLIEDSLVF